MITRLLALVVSMAALNTLVLADDFTLGSSTFTAPQGWTQIDVTDDHMTFATPDGRQRATITITHFDKPPAFQDFQLICSHRYDAERNGINDLVIIPKDPDPHNSDGQFTMHFSGEENPRSRVFAGYLRVKGQELVTVYVEGIDIPSERNADIFHAIVNSLR